MAMTPPYEPTLVMVDADLAEMPMRRQAAAAAQVRRCARRSRIRRHSPTSRRLLVNAQIPLIVADRVARTAGRNGAARRLAELLQIPVVDYGNRKNFPTNHHLNRFLRSHAARPSRRRSSGSNSPTSSVSSATCRTFRSARRQCGSSQRPIVIAISAIYVQGAGNFQDQQRFFNPTMAIAGDTEASLPYLIDAVNRAMTSERRAQNAARAARFSDAFIKRRQVDLVTRRRRLGCLADQRAAHVRRSLRSHQE